jgi:uncharacterized protein
MAASVASAIASTPTTTARRQVSHLILYFLLAYLGTWIMFLPLILIPSLSRDAFGLIFVLSAFTGPTLATVVVTLRDGGWQGLRELFSRVVRWRVKIRWYLVALFGFVVIWIGGYSIPLNGTPLQGLLTQPQLLVTVFLPFVLTVGLIPALGEEIGWRGYALPQLQKHFGPVRGTLLLGFLHSLWHLPAFFTPVLGPFMPLGFLAFIITGTAGTFVYTWIFNNARQSILIAVLTHAAANGASALLGVLAANQMPSNEFWLNVLTGGWFNAILFTAVAIVLVIATRGRLSYSSE